MFDRIASIFISLICFAAMLGAGALVVSTLALPATGESIAIALLSLVLFAAAFGVLIASLRSINA